MNSHPKTRIQIPDTITEKQIEDRRPRKRALLIGINYSHTEKKSQQPATQSEEAGPSEHSSASTKSGLELKGPHQDVHEMKQLLIEHYGYQEDDIDMLTDKAGTLVEPSRANILEHIRRMVKGAIPGDRFFFHYAGHTDQTENKNNTEEDGLDERLIPSDGLTIVDNELRQHLVDPLPVGSHLVAVFDSCHSDSLLDLPHHRCNRVYVPWLSKGKRRTAFLRNSVVRSNAMNVNISCGTVRKVYQTKRTSPTTVVSRKTSMFVASASKNEKTIPIKARSLSIKSHFKKSNDENSPIDILRCESPVAMLSNGYHKCESPISFFFGEIAQCESPVPQFPCDGWCRHTSAGEKKADVISLGSCKDSEVAWEDASGVSMTKALVKILKEEPHPTFKELMTKVSHSLHRKALDMHAKSRKYKEDIAHYASLPKNRNKQVERMEVETDNFQNPQLASHLPLDMDSRFNL